MPGEPPVISLSVHSAQDGGCDITGSPSGSPSYAQDHRASKERPGPGPCLDGLLCGVESGRSEPSQDGSQWREGPPRGPGRRVSDKSTEPSEPSGPEGHALLCSWGQPAGNLLPSLQVGKQAHRGHVPVRGWSQDRTGDPSPPPLCAEPLRPLPPSPPGFPCRQSCTSDPSSEGLSLPGFQLPEGRRWLERSGLSAVGTLATRQPLLSPGLGRELVLRAQHFRLPPGGSGLPRGLPLSSLATGEG